jgi:hypothetical protein
VEPMFEGATYYRVLLLRAIRDGRVTDWEGLKRFRRDHELRFIKWGSSSVGEPPAVISLLQSLQQAGLAVVAGVNLDRDIWVRYDSRTPAPDGVVVYDPGYDDSPSPPPALAISITISPRWRRIQDTLGISLRSLAELRRSRAMVVTPEGLLESRQEQQYTDVFVVMPFRAELRPVYDDHIVPVCDQLSLSVSRADDFFAAHAVMADVWGAIKDAKLVIADCTDRNPNVFYEIGLAHVLGKQVVLVTQKTEDIPFDLRHLRYITYEYTPRGMRNFEKTLKATLEGTIDVGG